MTATLCSVQEVKDKAGVGANASIIASNAWIERYINQAEDVVCSEIRTDLVAGYASLTTNGKKIINEAVSNRAAMYVVSYDPRGYVNVRASETILDVLWNGFTDAMARLKTDNVKKYLTIGAT